MSSPHHPTVSVSQFTILSSSPLKPSNFYFQDQDNTSGTLAHDEKFKPTTLTFSNEGHDDNGSYVHQQNENDEDFMVPVSQHHQHDLDENDAFKNTSYIKYPQQTANVFNNNNENSHMSMSQLHHHQEQLQQHQIDQQQHPQMNLYPPLEFAANQRRNISPNPSSRMRPSDSTNSLASHDSVPLLAMSTSISDTSIASPASFQNHVIATPRRPANTRRHSNLTTTPSQSFQTPSQNPSFTSPITMKNNGTGTTPSSSIQKSKPRHRRTRSRLSLDASGAASIVTIHHSTSTNSIRSPAATGTNPFYTPPAFLSPLTQNKISSMNESPAGTPLATPSGVKKYNSFSSISPNMLMNSSHGMNEEHQMGPRAANNSVYLAAADLTVRLASKYADQPLQQEALVNQPLLDFHQQQMQQRALAARQPNSFLSDPLNSDISQVHQVDQQRPLYHHQAQYSISNDSMMMDQIPEQISAEYSQMSSSSSSNSLSSNSEPIIITTKGPGSSTRTVSLSKPLSRSHSSINLSSIIAPPEIQHYDILQPRKKKLNKSNSTTTILQTNEALIKMGKPPKKVHCCPLCNAAFQRPEHVKRHMRSHSSEKPFECDQPGCGKRFNRPDNLKAHLRKIHKCAI